MANPLLVLTALSASRGAAISGSSGLIVQQGGLNVQVGNTVVQTLTASAISSSGDLKIGGNTVVQNLTASALSVTNNVNVSEGGLVLLNGSGGLEETIHGINFSVPMQVSSSDSRNHAIVKDSSGSLLLSNNVADLTLWGQTAVDVASYGGDLTLLAQNGTNKLVLSGAAGIILSSSAKVRTTEAAYSAINITPSSGLYDLDAAISGTNKAISDLSSSVGGNVDTKLNTLTSSYDNLRYVTTGSFDGNGHANFNLTTAGGAKFATSELNNILLDVAIDETNAGYWTNDLISVKLENSASALWITLDGPALTATSKYRFIAINEAKNKLSY